MYFALCAFFVYFSIFATPGGDKGIQESRLKELVSSGKVEEIISELQGK